MLNKTIPRFSLFSFSSSNHPAAYQSKARLSFLWIKICWNSTSQGTWTVPSVRLGSSFYINFVNETVSFRNVMNISSGGSLLHTDNHSLFQSFCSYVHWEQFWNLIFHVTMTAFCSWLRRSPSTNRWCSASLGSRRRHTRNDSPKRLHISTRKHGRNTSPLCSGSE